MESNASPRECPFRRPFQSPLDSGIVAISLNGIPPTPVKRGSLGTENASRAPQGSTAFVENLHSKLFSLQMQGEFKQLSQVKRNHYRRSHRFSPYSRSRSLCSISVETRSLVRRHASQTGIQKSSSIDKGIYAYRPSLTRLIKVSVENSENSANVDDGGSDTVKRKLMIRSASLRKAASLRILSQVEELVPTAPSSPIKFSARDRSIPSPIPIISPPPFIGPHALLSLETIAKIRLENYKERECRTAEYDYARSLQIVNGLWSGSPRDWEILLGLGQQTRRRRIDWLLQFLPKNHSHSTSSSFSSTSSTISSSSSPSFDQSMEGLVDQLMTSPETRFHAAWMFLRYHYLMGVVRAKGTAQEQLPIYPSTGIWDVTLASLAISVKFHRDFLHPLLPVEAVDYMQISPHDMGYEDFEAQRTMLHSFDYKLGVTPQPFLDQVWIAFPSLRKLLDFDGSWNEVRKVTWRLLLNSLYEPDVLRFSVSVLTAAALSRAIVSALTWRYYYKSDWNLALNFSRVEEGEKWILITPQQFRDRARDDAGAVIVEIEEVLKICDLEMKECCRWFEARSGPGLTV